MALDRCDSDRCDSDRCDSDRWHWTGVALDRCDRRQVTLDRCDSDRWHGTGGRRLPQVTSHLDLQEAAVPLEPGVVPDVAAVQVYRVQPAHPHGIHTHTLLRSQRTLIILFVSLLNV